jgi:hypothetical protein
LFDIVQRHAEGQLPPVPSSLTDEPIEPRADDLIMRALSLDPDARQQNAEAFLFELRTLMSMMGMRVRRVTHVHSHGVTPQS